MRVWVAFVFVGLTIVSCGDDGEEPGNGAPSAGAPASSGNGSAESGGTGAQSGRGSVQAGEGGGGAGGGTGGMSSQGGAGAGGVSGGASGSAGKPPVNPTLTAIEPSSLPIGTIEFELVLHGTNYRSDHQVSFDGNLFPTTFVSSEELHAEVPGAALGGRARTVNVLALRLGDPALRSNVLMFEVTEGEP
jgi:hypothetical protein